MKILRYFGIALSIAGLVVFGLALVRDPDVLLAAASRPAFGYALLLSIITIFISLLFAALKWNLLLSVFDPGKSVGLIGSIFLVTQIGKYLPGNVGHLIGRAAMLKSYKVAVGASSKAMLVEVAMLLATGSALVAAIMTDWLSAAIHDSAGRINFVVVALAVIAVGTAVCFVAVRSRERLKNFLWQLWADLITSRRRLAVVALVDLVNFTLNGLALFGSIHLLFPETSIDFVTCLGVAAASFLAGYVTPGAPGGLGVREATTTLLLGPNINAGEAALIALTLRLAATIADLIGFIVGTMILRGKEDSEGQE